MYLMYVDESGDTGLVGSPSRYFILVGLVIHELRWKDAQAELLLFRKELKARFGIATNSEIHASHLISRPGGLAKIPKYSRLEILRRYADKLAQIPYVSLISVVVDKSIQHPETDVFEKAWRVLIQRFENTLTHHNFPGPRNSDDMGMLFPDKSDERKLNRLIRRMRSYNPIPNASGLGYRNLQLRYVIEDINSRDSQHSYFVQSVDVAAYLLHQHISPSAYFKGKSGQNYFCRLDPVLCKVASPKDPQGIVRL